MPGAKFELLQEAYFEIGYSNAGALIANGTATDSIVFTSHNDGVFWGYSGDNAGGLWVGDGAATTTSFTYCIIEKATAGVYLDMAATVKNCTIRNNEGFGIVIAMKAPMPTFPTTFIRTMEVATFLNTNRIFYPVKREGFFKRF